MASAKSTAGKQRSPSGWRRCFILTGFAHFAPPLRGDLIAIVPPQLPAPGLLVTITGVLELLGAAAL